MRNYIFTKKIEINKQKTIQLITFQTLDFRIKEQNFKSRFEFETSCA